jgi:hypothetical protein
MNVIWSKTMRSLLCAAFLLGAPSVMAATLEVGTGKTYAAPSAAIAAAKAGDHVVIAPGEYFDCAVVSTNNLVIEGSDPSGNAVLTDKTCQGKAILVISGKDIVVRNLTLTRARVPDGNGAGIRAEGESLVVENVHFINNQNGILSSSIPTATLVVRNSEFIRNGACVGEGGCAHGIYAGQIGLLHIEASRFFETHRGHHIKSRAKRTEVIGCDISDGEQGTASYLIEVPIGGALLVRGNKMEKGPQAENHSAAIVIGAEGVSQQTPEITVTDNTFRNDGSYTTAFVRNLTATEAVLKGNKISGQVQPLVGDGSVK